MHLTHSVTVQAARGDRNSRLDLQEPACQCAVANVYFGLLGGLLFTEVMLVGIRNLSIRSHSWSAGRTVTMKVLAAGSSLLSRIIFFPAFYFLCYGVCFTLFLLGLCWWKCENDVLRQSYLLATVPLLDTLEGDFPLFPRSISTREDHLFWRGIYPNLRYAYQAWLLVTLICDLTIGSVAEPDVIGDLSWADVERLNLFGRRSSAGCGGIQQQNSNSLQ
jgi:hypothetical protein